jgi:undecaprenyl-diphosphatase
VKGSSSCFSASARISWPFVDWAGYSFPSGHAISATLLYGFLCISLFGIVRERHWRALTVAVSAVITLMVGFSRIALGAHYFTDVVAGITLGLFWLRLCMTGSRALRRRTCANIESTGPRASAELTSATDLAAA